VTPAPQSASPAPVEGAGGNAEAGASDPAPLQNDPAPNVDVDATRSQVEGALNTFLGLYSKIDNKIFIGEWGVGSA